MKSVFRVGMVCVCLGVGLPAGAQDLLEQAKGLYDSASYTEALSTLSQVGTGGDVVEVEKYRALCLLALNRPKDAEQSLERLAMSRPLFTLDGSDASPKLVALFHDVRKRTLPEAIKQTYQSAKVNFERGNMADAARQFKVVIAIADTAPPESAALMDDLKLLASGFLKLAETAQAPKVEAPAPATRDDRVAAAPTAPPSTNAAASSLPASAMPSATTPNRPAARSAALVAAARARNAVAGDRVYDSSDATVKPAVAMSRPIPKWDRPASLKLWAFQGLLEVVVGEDGVVLDAAMVKAINPAYDHQLIDAAKRWRFQAATFENRPVKYRLTYSIVIEPGS